MMLHEQVLRLVNRWCYMDLPEIVAATVKAIQSYGVTADEFGREFSAFGNYVKPLMVNFSEVTS